jgi:hypothetical protein
MGSVRRCENVHAAEEAENFFSEPAYFQGEMIKFLLWCILLVLCWPLALLALVLYPLVWILLLPFRIVGIAVGGVLELLWALVTLPARLLRA